MIGSINGLYISFLKIDSILHESVVDINQRLL